MEPKQGLVKEIFELEWCGMQGNTNNRVLFAARGVVVQLHQYRAWQTGRSTWAIKISVAQNSFLLTSQETKRFAKKKDKANSCPRPLLGYSFPIYPWGKLSSTG